MTKIEIKIDGDPEKITYIEKQRDFINTEVISRVIQRYKKNLDNKEEKIEFIRYLNPKYDAWMLLNENEDLKIKNGLQILVKLKEEIMDENQILKKNEIIGKIKSLNEKIGQEMNKLNKQKNIKIEDFRPSKTFYESKKYVEEGDEKDQEKTDKDKEKDNSINNYEDEKDFADIIILTANPLIDHREDQLENKELRTMNDFNLITDSIYNYILDCNKQIKARFLPLTENNLEISIYQKPKILHLICKSVYESENNDNNDGSNKNNLNNKYLANLLFENDCCEVERINENDLKRIFNSNDLLKRDKEILKNINLFISTPLSEDVFDMFKNFNFKNIIVQHTSLANVEFISEFNEQLYKNIIDLNSSIKNAFENAKKDSMNIPHPHQSCCCFHKHKDDCKFKMNLSNELYSDINIKEEFFNIPHFYHLRYKCDCNDKDFCNHIRKKNTCDNYRFSFNSLSKKISAYICCCYSSKKKHDLNQIFSCQYSEIKDEEGIFSNYKSNNFGLIINQEYVPNYGKMALFLGRNKIVYNIFDNVYDSIINKTHKIINIYGKESINNIDLLIDMIKEFLKERIPYMIQDDFQLNLNLNNNEEASDDLLITKKKTSYFKMNKFQHFIDKMNSFSSSSSSKTLNLNLFSADSAPQGLIQAQNAPIFEKIYFKFDQEKNISIINDIYNYKNKVYFINGFKITNANLIKIFEQKDLYQCEIILFTENKFEKYKDNTEICYLEFEPLKKNDYEIRYQNQKISYNRNNFNSMIANMDDYIYKKKEDLSKSTTIIKDTNKNNLNYEILFLFNCSNSGFFKMEMKALYPRNLNEIISIIETKFLPKRVIIKEEHKDEDPKKCYYRYNRNAPLFKDYYEARKDLIPNKVKQLLLEKLFNFYSLAFRFLLKKVKEKDWKNTENNIKIKLKTKFKPYDSLTSFSAIQDLGMWLPFEKSINEKNIELDIHNIYGYFNHLLRNFKDMFKDKNIMLCIKNNDIWRNVQEYIADISITLSTFLKMFSLNDQKLMNIFDNILKKEENYINPASYRFQLFDYMSIEYYKHKTKHLQELEKIENGFKNIGYIEGELETLFAECIINYRENGDLKKFEDIFKNKIMVKLLELKENNYPMDNKDKFISLFQSKVKYKYIKYKLKNKKLLNEDDISDLKELLYNFHKGDRYFFMIKTCFLISEWHWQKYQNSKKNGKEENHEKIEHLVYINFANCISNYYSLEINKKMDRRYIDYTRDFINNNYNLKKEKNNEIEERIKELYKEFNFKFSQKKENTFYVY